jgi:thiol-disulfide isomerase/thioredoxin
MLSFISAFMVSISLVSTGANAHDDFDAQTVLHRELAVIESTPFAPPSLLPGDTAPTLIGQEHGTGLPVHEIIPGRTHIVIIWGTWCTASIGSMPTFSELQTRYADELTVLAVAIRELVPADEQVENLIKYVSRHKEEIIFSTSVDPEETIEHSWKTASNQRGTPAAFIVGRDGRVAWIGHGLDPEIPSIVEEVITSKWDADSARATRLEMLQARHMDERTERSSDFGLLYHFESLVTEDKRIRAYQLTQAIRQTGTFDSKPYWLNHLAWYLVKDDGWGEQAAVIARDTAQHTLHLLDRDDADVLDTLALSYFRLGEYNSAINAAERAIEITDSAEAKIALMNNIKRFRAALRNTP